MSVALIYDEIFLEHRPHSSHPERPERLRAIGSEIEKRELAARTVPVAARAATREEILRVHGADYFDRLARELPGQAGFLDPDTYFSPQSWDAALKAAGAGVALSLDVLAGKDGLNAGFAMVRPPGHHAEATRAMGFCLFNNVAVAAEAALAEGGAKRVAILDWDVHHGNGTQNSFYERADVLYLSVHRYPFYPGTGAADEIGRGKGKGYTVNVPLPGGLGDPDYAAVFDRVIVPVMRQYDPDLIILSAGFDAHRTDPLGGMGLSDQAFHVLARKIRLVAEARCGGRIVAMLEGGYDIDALARSSCGVLEELLAEKAGDPGEIDGELQPPTAKVIERVRRELDGAWDL